MMIFRWLSLGGMVKWKGERTGRGHSFSDRHLERMES